MRPSHSNVILDAHLHLYPCFNLNRALDIVWDRLNQWSSPGAPRPRFMALVAERTGDPPLSDWIARPPARAGGTWSISAEKGRGIWLCQRSDGASITLIVGCQFATREKMEVLTLGPQAVPLNGLPIREIVAYLRATGQIPILPWSPGKWLFKRGRIVQELVEQMAPALALCDTAIRPRGIPAPAIFARARHLNCHIFAGSDPLPLAGEENGLGSYATGLADVDASGDPVEIVQNALTNPSKPVAILGRRNSVLQTLTRLIRYHAR